MRKKIRFGIKKKLLVTTLCIAVIPTLLFGAIISNVLYNYLYNLSVSHAASVVQQATDNFDEKLRGLELATKMAITDHSLHMVMQSDRQMNELKLYQPNGMISTDKHVTVSQFFTNLAVQNDYISGLVLLTNSDVYYQLSGVDKYNVNYRYLYKRSDWYQNSISLKGKVTFIGAHIPLQVLNAKKTVISVIRSMYMAGSEKYLGTIIIDSKADIFQTICNPALLESDSCLEILDSDNVNVYTFGNIVPGISGVTKTLTNKNGVFEEIIDNKHYIANYCISNYSGWKTVYYFPEENINKEMAITMILIYLAIACIVAIIIFGNYIVSINIVKPIVQLNKETKKINSGDFNSELAMHHDRSDEIGELYHTFRDMS